MLLAAPLPDIHQALVRLRSWTSGTGFAFWCQDQCCLLQSRVHRPAVSGAVLVDGRLFEAFHLDVGWGDPVVEPPDELTLPSLLEFAGIKTVTASCYPVTQHIAEKVHAYTRPHVSGESSRTKDIRISC